MYSQFFANIEHRKLTKIKKRWFRVICLHNALWKRDVGSWLPGQQQSWGHIQMNWFPLQRYGIREKHFSQCCLSFASFLLQPSPPQLDIYLCWVPLSLLLLSLSKWVSLAQVHASGNRQQDNQNKLSGIAKEISLHLLLCFLCPLSILLFV